MKVIDLGWCMARLTPQTTRSDVKLTIVSPSMDDDGFHSPAESVRIYGSVNILTLRDALNEAYPAEAKP